MIGGGIYAISAERGKTGCRANDATLKRLTRLSLGFSKKLEKLAAAVGRSDRLHGDGCGRGAVVGDSRQGRDGHTHAAAVRQGGMEARESISGREATSVFFK